MRLAPKAVPKTIFRFSGYNLFFTTTDKGFAATMFAYLAKNVKKTKEEMNDDSAIEMYKDTNTFCVTWDVKAAIIMYEYALKSGNDALQEKIDKLKTTL
jgi:hypothetical protein